jgi:flagellar biosynthesis GTPase FlhF
MELQRILAKDSRSAMEQVNALYGKDALVVSNKRARDKTELIIAVDLAHELEDSVEKTTSFDLEHRLYSTNTKSTFDQVMEEKIFKTEPNMNKSNSDPSVFKFTSGMEDAENDEAKEERERLKSREIVDLVKQEFAAMRQEFKLSKVSDAKAAFDSIDSEVQSLLNSLTSFGMPANLQQLITDIGTNHLTLPDALNDIVSAIDGHIDHNDVLEDMSGLHIICGGAGSGKTLMAARIGRQKAVDYGENNVAIVSFNDLRFGAWSQSNLLSSQGGVEVFRANSLESLDQLLGELSDRKLILIDTAAIDGKHSINILLSHLPRAKKHLVVGADASEGSINRYIQDGFDTWDSMMISKLEQGIHPWPIINALLNKNVPLALFSASSSILEAAVPITGALLVSNSLTQLEPSFV